MFLVCVTAARFPCQHADHKWRRRIPSNSYFFCGKFGISSENLITVSDLNLFTLYRASGEPTGIGFVQAHYFMRACELLTVDGLNRASSEKHQE